MGILRFGRSHSQKPSDMGIPCNPNPNSNPNRQGNMTRVLGMGMPISLYHLIENCMSGASGACVSDLARKPHRRERLRLSHSMNAILTSLWHETYSGMKVISVSYNLPLRDPKYPCMSWARTRTFCGLVYK